MIEQEKSIHILLIEPDPDQAGLLQQKLEQAGWRVMIAVDGKEGSEKLQTVPFNLVLLSQSTGVEKSHKVIQKLMSGRANLPVIVFTPAGQERGALEALNSGACGYVMGDAEGIYLDLLPQVIAQALNRQQLENERQTHSDALIASEARYRALVENQGEGVCILRLDKTIKYANPAMEILLNSQRGELVGQKLDDFLHRPDQAIFSEQIAKMEKERRRTFDLDLQTKDGSKRAVKIITTPLFDDQHNVNDLMVIMEDRTDRQRNETRLRYLVTHDILTGLYNRTMFETEMGRLEGGRIYPISIILLDVNALKDINDTRGFDAGDDQLRRTAQLLKTIYRVEDIIARIGGDEFAVLLPGVYAFTAVLTIRRLRDSISIHNQQYPESQLSLAIGTATTDDKSYPLVEVLKKAEERMYQEKAKK